MKTYTIQTFILLFISLCFSFFACKSSPDVKTEEGLAPLNIQEPLKLTPYQTEFTGDGTFHDAAFIAKDMKLGLNIGNTMEAY